MRPVIELISLRNNFISLLDKYKNDNQFRAMVSNATEQIISLERKIKLVEDMIDNYPLFQWLYGGNATQESILDYRPVIGRVSKSDTVLPF